VAAVGMADKPAGTPRTIVAFHSMYGVDGPFVGATNAIRGVAGDDLPWEVAHFASGSVTTGGHVKVVVRGLVFKDEDEVPADLRGINDEPNFRAVVSCLTESGDAVATANVATGPFKATASGNADIDDVVELPNPCVA